MLAAPQTEFSWQFVQGMANRMAVSYHKYGAIADGFPDRINALKSLQQRLDSYLETGNTEYLIDAANFSMIEYLHPSNPDAFFKATDSDGSPGRISANGESTYDRNKE